MVEYVKYKEKQLPILVSFNVLDELKKKNLEVKDLVNDVTIIKDIFWPAYLSGCFYTETKPEYKQEDVPFILDICMKEFIKKLPLFYPNVEEEDGSDDAKKK